MPRAAHAVSNPKFRFQAKNVFLTYPKCAEPKEDLLAHLQTLGPELGYGVVSHELHADGSDHLHALACFKTKYSTRDKRSFDWRGHHPNIQPARVVLDVANYVRKDKDFVEFGTLPDSATRGTADWESIANATTKSDFMTLVKEKAPKVIYVILV